MDPQLYITPVQEAATMPSRRKMALFGPPVYRSKLETRFTINLHLSVSFFELVLCVFVDGPSGRAPSLYHVDDTARTGRPSPHPTCDNSASCSLSPSETDDCLERHSAPLQTLRKGYEKGVYQASDQQTKRNRRMGGTMERQEIRPNASRGERSGAGCPYPHRATQLDDGPRLVVKCPLGNSLHESEVFPNGVSSSKSTP